MTTTSQTRFRAHGLRAALHNALRDAACRCGAPSPKETFEEMKRRTAHASETPLDPDALTLKRANADQPGDLEFEDLSEAQQAEVRTTGKPAELVTTAAGYVRAPADAPPAPDDDDDPPPPQSRPR